MIREFEAEDIISVRLQKMQEEAKFLQNIEYAKKLKEISEGYTLVDKNDNVIAVFGIANVFYKRGLLWGFFSDELTGNKGIAYHKLCKKCLDKQTEYERIEAHIRTDFEEGHRMIKMYGFKRECTMKKFWCGEYDNDLYARIY